MVDEEFEEESGTSAGNGDRAAGALVSIDVAGEAELVEADFDAGGGDLHRGRCRWR